MFSPPKSNSIKTSKSSSTKKNSNNKISKRKQEKITNFEPKQEYLQNNSKSKEKNSPIPGSFLKLRDLQGYIIVGDNFRMLVTVLAICLTSIYYIFLYICLGHQHSKDVTEIEFPLLTSKNRHQLKVTNFCVTCFRKGDQIVFP